jgi:hypothetical protein
MHLVPGQRLHNFALIPDRTCPGEEGEVCRAFVLPASRAALKPRTHFRRNFVRGLSPRIRELSAMTMRLNRGFVDYIYQRFFRVSRWKESWSLQTKSQESQIPALLDCLSGAFSNHKFFSSRSSGPELTCRTAWVFV